MQVADIPDADVRREIPASDLLSDEAVYRRTRRGQRALLASDELSSEPMLRVLARVNGYTNLRSLVEMAPGDAGFIARSVRQLFTDGLIEFVQLTGDQAFHAGL